MEVTRTLVGRFFIMLFFALSCLGSQGCVLPGAAVVTDDAFGPGQGGGPPPWAPAHGYRAKYRYHYYPEVAVYLDVSRGVYFYPQNGRWVSAASLPRSLTESLGNYVVLEMDTDRPYEFHKDVLKKYPPGQSKKQGKGHGSGKPYQ